MDCALRVFLHIEMAIFLLFGMFAGIGIRQEIYHSECAKLLTMPLYSLSEVIVKDHI